MSRLRRLYHFFVPTCPPPTLTDEERKRGAVRYAWNGFQMRWETRNTTGIMP